MAFNAGQDAALVRRANLNIAAAVVAKHGSGASDSLIGHAIDQVRASHSVSELAGSGGMAMVVGAVETFLARNSEADRPRNLYGAETARAVQAAGIGQHGGHGEGTALGRYSSLLAGRGGRDPGGDSDGGAPGGSGSRSGTTVSGTGSEPAGAPFWGSAKGMLLTRSYANDNGMGWAPADLMQMGRPALQALKESGLKGDGYKALRDPSGLHLDNKTIVQGAQGYMKRHGVDHNEAAKSSAAVDRLAMPADMRKRHRDAVEGIHTATPKNEAERREALKKSGDEIVQHNPAHKATVERERRGYKVDQGNVPKAEAKADQKDAKSDAKVEKVKPAQMRQDATKSKLLSMYK